jgi:hypothetical protein
VHFVFIGHKFSGFGLLCQEKSGNPVHDQLFEPSDKKVFTAGELFEPSRIQTRRKKSLDQDFGLSVTNLEYFNVDLRMHKFGRRNSSRSDNAIDFFSPPRARRSSRVPLIQFVKRNIFYRPFQLIRQLRAIEI